MLARAHDLATCCPSNVSRIHLSPAEYKRVQATICVSRTWCSVAPKKCLEKFQLIVPTARPQILLPSLNASATANVSLPGNDSSARCSNNIGKPPGLTMNVTGKSDYRM